MRAPSARCPVRATTTVRVSETERWWRSRDWRRQSQPHCAPRHSPDRRSSWCRVRYRGIATAGGAWEFADGRPAPTAAPPPADQAGSTPRSLHPPRSFSRTFCGQCRVTGEVSARAARTSAQEPSLTEPSRNTERVHCPSGRRGPVWGRAAPNAPETAFCLTSTRASRTSMAPSGAISATLHAGHTKTPSATLLSSVPSCRSLSPSEDSPSCHCNLSSEELAQNLQESIRHWILHLAEQLRVEEASRDENTVGYLKLVSNADRHQAPHIRQAFEKVNQHTSATTAHIERRLRQCHQQLQELEEGCRPKGMVLIAGSSLENCQQPNEKISFSESPQLSRGAHQPSLLESSPAGLQQGRPSETKPATQPPHLLLLKVKKELEDIQKTPFHLQVSYQSLKDRYLMDLQVSLESLQEQKCRQTVVEEQVNEHLQGHLDEIYHLKQNLACTEEKMAYLSCKRAKEIWEVMESFQSRIAKLEVLQQIAQLQMTGCLRSRPQDVLFRLTSLLFMLATVLLASVSTMCAYLFPLANSRLRTGTVLLLLGLMALAWQKWHAIATADWQAWVLYRWRLYSKDSRAPSDGPCRSGGPAQVCHLLPPVGVQGVQ